MRAAAALVLLLSTFAIGGCATMDKLGTGVRNALPGGIAKPVKYRLAGADRTLRANVERGLTQLKEDNYQDALVSLNRGIWELERIEKRSLRVEELAEVYHALADAYLGLKKPDWAGEQRRLAVGLLDDVRQGASDRPPQRSLDLGKKAYAGAQFRKAVTALRRALVELEAIGETGTRIRRLEEARCYLAFAHFALEDKATAREELRRLFALDSSVSTCSREAPPAIRPLISEVRRERNVR
jgi:tetratricopeptide (TPR) repeat protein